MGNSGSAYLFGLIKGYKDPESTRQMLAESKETAFASLVPLACVEEFEGERFNMYSDEFAGDATARHSKRGSGRRHMSCNHPNYKIEGVVWPEMLPFLTPPEPDEPNMDSQIFAYTMQPAFEPDDNTSTQQKHPTDIEDATGITDLVSSVVRFAITVKVYSYPPFSWECEIDTDALLPPPETPGLYDDVVDNLNSAIKADPNVMIIPGVINRREIPEGELDALQSPPTLVLPGTRYVVRGLHAVSPQTTSTTAPPPPANAAVEAVPIQDSASDQCCSSVSSFLSTPILTLNSDLVCWARDDRKKAKLNGTTRGVRRRTPWRVVTGGTCSAAIRCEYGRYLRHFHSCGGLKPISRFEDCILSGARGSLGAGGARRPKMTVLPASHFSSYRLPKDCCSSLVRKMARYCEAEKPKGFAKWKASQHGRNKFCINTSSCSSVANWPLKEVHKSVSEFRLPASKLSPPMRAELHALIPSELGLPAPSESTSELRLPIVSELRLPGVTEPNSEFEGRVATKLASEWLPLERAEFSPLREIHAVSELRLPVETGSTLELHLPIRDVSSRWSRFSESGESLSHSTLLASQTAPALLRFAALPAQPRAPLELPATGDTISQLHTDSPVPGSRCQSTVQLSSHPEPRLRLPSTDGSDNIRPQLPFHGDSMSQFRLTVAKDPEFQSRSGQVSDSTVQLRLPLPSDSVSQPRLPKMNCSAGPTITGDPGPASPLQLPEAACRGSYDNGDNRCPPTGELSRRCRSEYRFSSPSMSTLPNGSPSSDDSSKTVPRSQHFSAWPKTSSVRTQPCYAVRSREKCADGASSEGSAELESHSIPHSGTLHDEDIFLVVGRAGATPKSSVCVLNLDPGHYKDVISGAPNYRNLNSPFSGPQLSQRSNIPRRPLAHPENQR